MNDMTSDAGRRLMRALLALLLLLTLGVALLVEPPTITDANSAAILGFVTAGAVAIERAIEGVWTLLGSRWGTWWPLKPIGDRLDAFVDDLNKPLKEFQQIAEQNINAATDKLNKAPSWITDAKSSRAQVLRDLQKHTRNLQQLEPGNPRARAISAAATRAVVGLKNLYPSDREFDDLREKAEQANKVLAGVENFVQTFEDNPARRLMSLLMGALLGLLVAGILGLDAIQAVFEGKPKGGWIGAIYGTPLAGIGIAATGIVMGLGSVPAHEAIKALQEVKKRSKRGAYSE